MLMTKLPQNTTLGVLVSRRDRGKSQANPEGESMSRRERERERRWGWAGPGRSDGREGRAQDGRPEDIKDAASYQLSPVTYITPGPP